MTTQDKLNRVAALAKAREGYQAPQPVYCNITYDDAVKPTIISEGGYVQVWPTYEAARREVREVWMTATRHYSRGSDCLYRSTYLMLTTGKAAHVAGVSRAYIWQQIKDSKLPATYNEQFKRWLVDEADLAIWQKERQAPGRPRTKE